MTPAADMLKLGDVDALRREPKACIDQVAGQQARAEQHYVLIGTLQASSLDFVSIRTSWPSMVTQAFLIRRTTEGPQRLENA